MLPSFYSRVSNAHIFARAGVLPLSEQLLHRQLALLGKVALSSDHGVLRRDTFEVGGLQPLIGKYVRKVGRPRQDWTNEVLKAAVARMGASKVQGMLTDTTTGARVRWKQELRRVFK